MPLPRAVGTPSAYAEPRHNGQAPAGWLSDPRRLSWIAVLHGAIAAVAGVLVLAWPGRTLVLLGVAIGAYLLAWGAIRLATAVLAEGMLSMERAAQITVGVLAIAVGAIVVARPGGTVTAIALAAGIYLLLAGTVGVVSAFAHREQRAAALARAALDLVVGAIVVVWPGIGLATLALVLGCYLVLLGIFEIASGLFVRFGPGGHIPGLA